MRGGPYLVVSIGYSRLGVETDQVVAGPFEGRISFVRTVSFSPDGSLMLSPLEASVKIWNARNGSLISSLEGHANTVHTACFSPCGEYVASASYDGAVRLWKARSGSCEMIFTRDKSPVGRVAFSPDDNTLVSGVEDGTVLIIRWREFLPLEEP